MTASCCSENDDGLPDVWDFGLPADTAPVERAKPGTVPSFVPAIVIVDDLGAVIDKYLTDQDSTFKDLRHVTQRQYLCLLRRLREDFAARPLTTIRARDIRRMAEVWTEGGKVAMAHSLAAMLRTVMSFGATYLESGECARISAALKGMRFKMPKARTERLSSEQAVAVRAVAHDRGLHSVALAQAFQTGLMVRQKDVIGEYAPIGMAGPNPVIFGDEAWSRGLRWEEIDADLRLHHVTSKRQKEIKPDLTLHPAIMEELDRHRPFPPSGPIVVYERTGRPYRTHQFRHLWRILAKAAGVPPEVKNMDSRAGAASEALRAGATLEDVRHALTHSDIATTQGYLRAIGNPNDEVANARYRKDESEGEP